MMQATAVSHPTTRHSRAGGNPFPSPSQREGPGYGAVFPLSCGRCPHRATHPIQKFRVHPRSSASHPKKQKAICKTDGFSRYNQKAGRG
ncbi:MAG: hypothetical protein KC445_21000 [Anaerolineales bacterium]|nr:hypothetical protein [Anaerolineales bacterium]